jgi:hypothetical protein
MTSVYNSRKKSEHLRGIYMIERKREKICMGWQMKRPIILQLIAVQCIGNIFFTGK